VSGKDRGAVPMAGHAGKAFWMSTNTGDFVTSSFYYDDYPTWVRDWNSLRRAEEFADSTWELLGEKSTYIMGHRDDRPYETDLNGFGRVFPHRYGDVDDKLLFTQVLVSPAGDKLTLDFARALLRNEGLGQDDIPDYLSLSFSGVDAVNHIFGPSSLENEDVVRHLDRTIADLIDFIDETVGMDHTLVVLAADHGMADMPEYMSELGLNAGRIYPEDVMSIANDAGREHFDIDGIAEFFYRPYVYLDDAKLAEAGLEKGHVGPVIAEALTRVEGIALALARGQGLPAEAMPIHAQVLRNFHTSRSGDIYVVQDPYWFLYERGPVAAMHGSPWRYDTHVPIMFGHPGLRPQTVYRLVHPVDIAPTIAAILGISPPSSSQGVPLQEVVQ
jgi:predicted AlkP superfamily pyrophosphatase or phosphodiesterase